MQKITLGDKVKDTITGFKGIAIGRTTWLTGCDRITVQPEGVTKEGKIFESLTFDEGTLSIITPKKVKEGQHKKGGFNIKVSKY